MFSWFIRNRRGSITIMITAVLIAVMSMSTTLIEIARFRSLERIFQEVVENAAFSVLSQYDRDLYENFGLLAVSQDVDKEDFIVYLEENLAGLQNGSQNNVDRLLKLTEKIQFDKLYDLTQDDVLREQIMEFTALRAPVSLVNNSLNLEKLIQDLVEELEECMPVLTVFKNVVSMSENVLKLSLEMLNLADKGRNLQEADNEYEKSLDEYNRAVRERDDYMEAYADSDEEGDSEGEGISEEEYERVLREKNGNVKACAAVVRSNLENLKGKLAEYYEQYDKFQEAFSGMLNSSFTETISASKAMYTETSKEADQQGKATQNAKSAKAMVELLEKTEDGYKRTKEQGESITDAMGEIHDAFIMDTQNRLSSQKENLNREPEQLGEMNRVDLNGTGGLWGAVEIVLRAAEFLVSIVQTIWEGLKTITELIELAGFLSQDFPVNGRYNNIIDAGTMQTLAGHKMGKPDNPFAAADEAAVKSKIAAASQVAGSVGFDISELNAGNGAGENFIIQNAMEKHDAALQIFLDACEDMTSWMNLLIIPLVENLLKVIVAVGVYIASCIELCTVMITQLQAGDLIKIVYQRLYTASYACDMFSNYTTDLESDKRLNGSSYFDFQTIASNGGCFDIGNAEYIFAGGANEYLNVEDVAMRMMMIRCLCNIPAVLTNEPVMQVAGGLCSTGIGVVLAIILILCFVVLEADLDMIFLQYAGSSVPIVKTKGYLTPEGLDELKKKLEGILKSNGAAKELIALQRERAGEGLHELTDADYSGKEEEKINESVLEKWEKGLTEWNYKDHLFFMMLICKSNDVILARCADLIDMQMRKKKLEAGESTAFRLEEMAAYIRVDATAAYQPVLPVPIIPGLDGTEIPIRSIRYSGY